MSQPKSTSEQAGMIVPTLALTRLQAADALGISPATVDRLTVRGLLRPSRAIRRPLYSVAESERFLRDTRTHQ